MDQGNSSAAPVPNAQDSAGLPHQGAPSASLASEVLDRQTLLQHAYLLGQLESPDGAGATSAVLNRRITKAVQRQLGLTAKLANTARARLAQQGYLAAAKEGRSIRYVLTEAGHTYLENLEKPILSGKSRAIGSIDDSTITDEIRNGQNAILLLQLLNADGETLTQGEANQLLTQSLRTSLSLTPASANCRRERLAELGYLRVLTSGRTKSYSLTPDGREYLAAGAHHLDHLDFLVKGRTLNALVAAARESSFRIDLRTESLPVAAVSTPDKATLEKAILAIFEELLRERHGRSGLVPIPEVRQRIAERFGTDAGRHDVLDEVILGLWRQRRVGLEGISDLSQATRRQLDDAIPGVSGPLFYLENAREQAVTQS